MIKKFISICSAFVLVSGLYAANAVNAAFEAPEITMSNIPYIYADESDSMKNSSNSDLYALASSLGADTDYFNFVNYVPESMSSEVMISFAQQISQHEATLNKLERGTKAAKAGLCHGMSILQILTHNGIISPSDIQEGAENLNDITYSRSVNDILCYYAMTQIYDVQEFAINYFFCQSDTAAQCRSLIEHGEKAIEEGEYFYISLNMPVGNHAVVGIGAADGNWEYNGKKYDKCILTLDSNVVDEATDEAAGFSEKACIYINSETNEFYLPAYECSNEDAFIMFVCDNESLLNYKGLIAPSQAPEFDISEMLSVEIDNFAGSEYEFTVSDKNSSTTFWGKAGTALEELCPNNWIFFEDCYKYFIDGESVQIKSTAVDEYETDTNIEMHVIFDKSVQRIYAEGYFTADFQKNKVSLENNNPDKSNCYLLIMLEEGEYNSSPYCSYNFQGNYDGILSMENRNDGILINTTSGFEGSFTAQGINNDHGVLTYFGSGKLKKLNLTSSGNVLIRYDASIESFKIFTDSNGDDVYDHEVQKGDVDCDNVINAIDASYILTAYAAAQTGKYHYINENLGDYNSDGKMDAIDASEVLTYYAKTQVENMQ